MDQLIKEVLKHKCETDLLFFCRYFFQVMFDNKFITDDHHREVAQALESCAG